VSSRAIFLILALAVVAASVAGCGDNRPDTTGTALPSPSCTVGGDEEVVFGEGEIPASVPGDFPIPSGAAVGSTMVDRVNHRSEFAITVALEADALVRYYTVSLVSSGFVVDSSAGDMFSWRIEFSREELLGEMVIQPGGTGLAAAVVSLNTC
jgi:hypothetical protein